MGVEFQSVHIYRALSLTAEPRRWIGLTASGGATHTGPGPGLGERAAANRRSHAYNWRPDGGALFLGWLAVYGYLGRLR